MICGLFSSLSAIGQIAKILLAIFNWDRDKQQRFFKFFDEAIKDDWTVKAHDSSEEQFKNLEKKWNEIEKENTNPSS